MGTVVAGTRSSPDSIMSYIQLETLTHIYYIPFVTDVNIIMGNLVGCFCCSQY